MSQQTCTVCGRTYDRAWRSNTTVCGPACKFEQRVERTDGCWLWTGTLDDYGYGQLYGGFENGRERAPLKAHRLAYELFVGPIPDGLTIDHVCQVKRCVNPAHLDVVTKGENTRRRHRPGYFNQPMACKRGHDWTKYPPGIAVRKNGTVSRTCWACRTERRGKNPDEVKRAPYRRRTDHAPDVYVDDPAAWQVAS